MAEQLYLGAKSTKPCAPQACAGKQCTPPMWPTFYHSCAGFPVFVAAASRWSCQWDDSCQRFNQSRKCAPIIQSFGLASAAIWEADDSVPIVLNGLGQNTPWEKCGGGTYKAM